MLWHRLIKVNRSHWFVTILGVIDFTVCGLSLISCLGDLQVQIHGPICLSENVDCIVANSRHRTNKTMVSLLQKFIDQNHCNLIWMDQPPASPTAYHDYTSSIDSYDDYY